MSLRTAVGEVAVVGGDPSERPSGILVDERASRSAKAKRRGNLYVLVEVTGPAFGRDLISRQLLDTVRTTYFAWQGSVTAGLQQAIHEVNDWLVSENRNSLRGEQRTAGISCAVLRDDDLFIAQAGPASVYFAHEGSVTRFPDTSPWLDDTPVEDADVVPLGVRREVNVALFHTPVSDGDLLLLLESTFVRGHSPQLPILLVGVPAEELPAAIKKVARGSDVVALVVNVGGESMGEAPAVAAAPAIGRLPGQPGAESLQERAATLIGQVPWKETFRRVGRGLVALLGGLWSGLLTLLRRMLPSQIGPETPAPKPGTRARQAQSLPGKRPREVLPVKPRTNSLRKILAGLAIAIPVVVSVVVLAMVVQRGRNQKAEMEALWTSANQKWEQAEAAGDKAAKRANLKEAAGYLEQLRERLPERADVEELQQKVLARQDELDLVRRITSLYGLKTYPSSAKLTRVIVQDFDIYVLDENGGKVYHHKLDTTQQSLEAGTADTVLVERGNAIGGVVVGDLVDMAWVPVGDGRPQAGLVVLESNGYLVEYMPTTERLTSLRPAGAENWQFPQLVGGRTPGRVYVLDPAPDKIWRYQSTAQGFSAPPDDWLTAPVDLNGVVDMSIGDSIYLLFADSTISRLSAGAPDTFAVTDWDSPPSNPSAIVARPSDEAKSIYVADRGNGRIVQTGVEGRFERQFKLDLSIAQGSDVLSSVSSLAVNEISGQVVFASGNTLYIFLLPQ